MVQFNNRIDHIAWVVHTDNQEAYVEKLEKLFGIRFEGPLIRDEFGIRLWMSWESGLEIISPWGTGEHAKMWADRLAERGEGIHAMVFGVPNIEESSDHARQLGYGVSPTIGFAGSEPWKHKLETFKEAVVGDFMGTMVCFGEIRYPDGVVDVGT